jgi:hypothetical protein
MICDRPGAAGQEANGVLVPPHVSRVSRRVFDLREDQTTVLPLTGDSLLDDRIDLPDGVDRCLIFDDGHTVATVSLIDRSDPLRVSVSVCPVVTGTPRELRTDGSAGPVKRDDDGVWFSLRPGVVSLLLGHAADGVPVRTAWIRL